MLGGVAVLLATALAFFFAAPLVKLRRRRLEPFREDDAPDVAAELGGLVAEAGLERAPRFVWNPLNPSPGGLAFGRPGRYYVALSGGLVTTFYTDRPAFRAVVLHELAHLRNRDVAKTYFTVSIWWAFVLVAVLPFLVSLADEDANTVFDLGWRLVALTVFVYLTRNAVLRAREVYADVRASTSEGVTPALTKLLGAMRAPARPWLNRLVGLHPSPAVRLRALEDPRGLFSLGTFEAFGAGIAATIAFAEVVTLVDFFAVEALSTMWISALVFAPLAVGVVGLGAWRSAFGALALGERPRGSWRLGVALGVGFLVGQHFSLVAALGPDPTIISAKPWTLDVLWSVVLLVGLGLFVAWITTSACTWLPVAAPSRSPAWASALGLVVAAGVLTVFMGIFFLVRTTRDVIEVSTSGTAELHDFVVAGDLGGADLALPVRHGPGAALVRRAPARVVRARGRLGVPARRGAPPADRAAGPRALGDARRLRGAPAAAGAAGGARGGDRARRRGGRLRASADPARRHPRRGGRGDPRPGRLPARLRLLVGRARSDLPGARRRGHGRRDERRRGRARPLRGRAHRARRRGGHRHAPDDRELRGRRLAAAVAVRVGRRRLVREADARAGARAGLPRRAPRRRRGRGGEGRGTPAPEAVVAVCYPE